MKKLSVSVAAIGLIALGTTLLDAAEQTWKGTISDSLCGASHAAMAQIGSKVSDRECTVACVSYATEDSPKYVVVSGGKVYAIANQKFPGLARNAGRALVVTGELKGEVITVSKIETPPNPPAR